MKFKPNSRLSEANIQAEIYHQCKMYHIKCYLEYKHEHSRFDVVIVWKDEIVCIIECKSYKTDKSGKTNTKQHAKYSQYSLPVFLVTRLEQVPQLISDIQALLISK